MRHVAISGFLVLALLASGDAQAGEGDGFGLPITCSLGETCFVQQLPDTDPGPGVTDPLCGDASYQGHDGIDIRVRSLADIRQDVPVVSIGDGDVLRIRDGIVDQLFTGDPAAIKGKECGNGAVIRHAEGFVSQYCHMKRGSVTIRPGQHVAKGETLGAIGASGLAAFPHVHLSIRHDDMLLEPLTGEPLQTAKADCGKFTGSLFGPAALDRLTKDPVAILDSGLAGAPPILEDLAAEGAPAAATSHDAAFVAWVWAINLQSGDRISILVTAPDGSTAAETTTDPVPRHKAAYLAFAGRRHAATPGNYRVSIHVLRGERPVAASEKSVPVE